MRSLHVFVWTGAVVAFALAARADTVSIGAAKDNTLYESATGALSNGAGPGFTTGRTGGGLIRRGLIAFDIAAAVPAGSIIDDVTLTLHMSRTSAGPAEVALHAVLADWGEGTSNAGAMGDGPGAPATPGDATWVHRFFDTDFWTTPGGDFAPAPSAATNVDQIGFYSWSSAAMAADAQGWLDNPAAAFGWVLLVPVGEVGLTKRFDTRESPDAGLRPVLTINYTIPAPPAALVFAAFTLALRRRRA